MLIMAFRHGLAVFDLDDGHGKAVVVTAGSRNVTLSPGMQTVITSDSGKSFEQINPAK